MSYHDPVLLQKCIEGLEIKPDGIYVDATFGGGGHAKEILKKLRNGRLIAFDQDEEAMANKINDDRFTLVNVNFKFMKNFLMYYDALPVDGILADLGISSHQIDNPSRGFSTRFEADLDMRMDSKNPLHAKKILAEYSAEALRNIFSEFGEIRHSMRLSNAIVEERKQKPINTVEDLKKVAVHFAEKGLVNKLYAQVFQALRIEINQELDALKELLIQSVDVLKQEGRLVVISYHSLEDRLVKNIMKTGNFEGILEKDFYGMEKAPMKMLTRKPVVPGIAETEGNNRARSAKLRIAVKL